MLPFTCDIVSALLPSLSSDVPANLRELAKTGNQSLMKLVLDSDLTVVDADGRLVFQLVLLLKGLADQFENSPKATKLGAFRWLLLLQSKLPVHVIFSGVCG